MLEIILVRVAGLVGGWSHSDYTAKLSSIAIAIAKIPLLLQVKIFLRVIYFFNFDFWGAGGGKLTPHKYFI